MFSVYSHMLFILWIQSKLSKITTKLESKCHEKLVEEAWGLDSGKEIYYEGVGQRALWHLYFGWTREETMFVTFITLGYFPLWQQKMHLHRQDFLKVCRWESLDWVYLHEQGVFELCNKKQHEGAW